VAALLLPGRLNNVRIRGGLRAAPGAKGEAKMPRSTEDIVDEMKMEAENFDRVGIAVVFEGEGDTAKVNLVASNDSDPLSKLNDLLEQGGKPIG
jgi:hypothetical protein